MSRPYVTHEVLRGLVGVRLLVEDWKGTLGSEESPSSYRVSVRTSTVRPSLSWDGK